MTAAFIAQLLTIGVCGAARGRGRGPADLPLRQHSRRRRAQPPARGPLRRPPATRRLTEHHPRPEGTTTSERSDETAHHQDPSADAPSCVAPLAAAARRPAQQHARRRARRGSSSDTEPADSAGVGTDRAPTTRSAWPTSPPSTRSSSTAATASTTWSSRPRISRRPTPGSHGRRSPPSTQIAQELQPRFVGGNPPDLIDNSGENAIGFSTILDQLEDLGDVLDANNLEGTPIATRSIRGRESARHLRRQARGPQLRADGLRALVLREPVRGERLEPPQTWDEAIDLGAAAKAKDKYLFLWGKEAATYYQTLAIGSAIKEGGDEVRLALENLAGDCWSHARGAGRASSRDGRDRRARLLQARAAPAPSSPPPRPSGATTRRRCSTRPGRGSRTR